MPEAAEGGAALNFLDWAQEGVGGLGQIWYHIVSVLADLIRPIWVTSFWCGGLNLVGSAPRFLFLKMYTTVKLVVLVVAR